MNRMFYPPKKEGIHEEKHTIVAEKRSYVLTTRSSDNSILLYIGGHHTYCIEAQIFKEDSYMRHMQDITLGDLPHVYYNEACAIDDKFLRGTDTRRILKLIMGYVAKTYPRIRGFTFSDESTRECDDKQSIGLAFLHYLLYGETWYATVIGSDLFEKKDKDEFIDKNEKFQKLKTKLPWNDFKDIITTKLPISEEMMKGFYETSETWTAFFIKIRDKVTASIFCSFVAPWINQFRKIFFQFDFTKVKHVVLFSNPKLTPLMEFELKTYVHRGGSSTRRRRSTRVQDVKE